MTNPVIPPNDTQEWYVDGKLHRTDGPAYIGKDGTYIWYKHDLPHRTDGPAYIGKDGDQYWYVDGKQHRIDGPAVIYADGDHDWCVDGMRCWTPESYQKAAKISDEDMLAMTLKYGVVK